MPYKTDIEKLNQKLKNNPKDYDTNISLSKAYFFNLKYNKAIEILEKAKKMRPKRLRDLSST